MTAPETLRRLWGERQVPDMHWVLRCAYIWESDWGRTEVADVQRGQVGERGGEEGDCQRTPRLPFLTRDEHVVAGVHLLTGKCDRSALPD